MKMIKGKDKKPFGLNQSGVLILVGIVILITAVIVMMVVLKQPERPISSLPENLDRYMTYEIVNNYPHDPKAFTQGLVYLDGFLYESTGLYGESSLRKVALETGEVLQQVDLASQYFAEGLTEWENTLVQLTWREETAFVYNRADFSLMTQYTYPTEGWGLTHNGEKFIMSDGSAVLYFLDPVTFALEDSLAVSFQGESVTRLNELEYVRGEVFANVWQTDDIVRIDPETGFVVGWIDLTGLLSPDERTPEADVLNGIAYDSDTDRLFVTGKMWQALYEIRLVPLPADE